MMSGFGVAANSSALPAHLAAGSAKTGGSVSGISICLVTLEVQPLPADTWNVNPIALKRIEKLFCKNERAVVRTRLPSGDLVTLVPVAAILVASIRLHFLDTVLSSDHRGPKVFRCEARFRKGEEMGWFEHGSTIIVFAQRGFALAEGIGPGAEIRMGQALIRRPEPAPR